MEMKEKIRNKYLGRKRKLLEGKWNNGIINT